MKISFKNFSPADKLNFYFLIFLQILLLIGSKRIENFVLLFSINFLFIFYLVIFCNRERKLDKKFILFLQLWYPVIFIPVIFTEFRYIIPAIRPHDLDFILIRLDNLIFGKPPSVILEKYLNPYFVDLLQICYSFFYFIPLITGIYIISKRNFEDYDFFYFYVCYGFFLSYIGYLFVPAIGPRFTLKSLYSVSIQGHFIYNTLVSIQNSVEKIHRDCFPSGHTMMVLMVLHYNFKKYRNLFWLFVIPSIFLLLATVFLRYHYFVDLLGGVVFYFFVIFTSKSVWHFFKKNL